MDSSESKEGSLNESPFVDSVTSKDLPPTRPPTVVVVNNNPFDGGGDDDDGVYMAPSAVDVLGSSGAGERDALEFKDADSFEDPFEMRLSEMLSQPPISPANSPSFEVSPSGAADLTTATSVNREDSRSAAVEALEAPESVDDNLVAANANPTSDVSEAPATAESDTNTAAAVLADDSSAGGGAATASAARMLSTSELELEALVERASCLVDTEEGNLKAKKEVVAEASVFVGDSVAKAKATNARAASSSRAQSVGTNDGDRIEVDLEEEEGGDPACGLSSPAQFLRALPSEVLGGCSGGGVGGGGVGSGVGDDLVVVDGLGRGSFSAVLLVQRRSNPSTVFALKVTDKCSILEPKQRRRLQAERLVLGALPPHPFLARLHSAFQTPAELFYLMEYCPGGSLGTQLENIYSRGVVQRFKDAQARVWLCELVLGLEHLQFHGFVHRDLKADNVMLDQQGHVKLIDFGLCKRIRSNPQDLLHLRTQQRERCAKQLAALAKHSKSPLQQTRKQHKQASSSWSSASSPQRKHHQRHKASTRASGGSGGGGVGQGQGTSGFTGSGLEPMSPCGSLAFMAPEFFSRSESLGSFAVDWWGLGCLSCELLMGKLPWRHAKVTGSDVTGDLLRAEVAEGLVPGMLPSFLSANACSLIKGLLDKAHWRRLGYFCENQVKAHSFFQGTDWEKVLGRHYDPPFHPCKPKPPPSAATTNQQAAALGAAGAGAAAAGALGAAAAAGAVDSVLGIRNFSASDRQAALSYYVNEEAALLVFQKLQRQRQRCGSSGRVGNDASAGAKIGGAANCGEGKAVAEATTTTKSNAAEKEKVVGTEEVAAVAEVANADAAAAAIVGGGGGGGGELLADSEAAEEAKEAAAAEAAAAVAAVVALKETVLTHATLTDHGRPWLLGTETWTEAVRAAAPTEHQTRRPCDSDEGREEERAGKGAGERDKGPVLENALEAAVAASLLTNSVPSDAAFVPFSSASSPLPSSSFPSSSLPSSPLPSLPSASCSSAPPPLPPASSTLSAAAETDPSPKPVDAASPSEPGACLLTTSTAASSSEHRTSADAAPAASPANPEAETRPLASPLRNDNDDVESALATPLVLFRGFDLALARPALGEATPWEWWTAPTQKNSDGAEAVAGNKKTATTEAAAAAAAAVATVEDSAAAGGMAEDSTVKAKKRSRGASLASGLGGSVSWLRSLVTTSKSKGGGK